MNIVLLLILFLSIIILNVYLLNKNTKQNKEKFISEYNDPEKDGKMTFNFLKDPNYGSNIINTYYLNDDTKTNNIRNVFHPYQQKTRKYFGNPKFCQNDFKKTNAIYKQYGIRV